MIIAAIVSAIFQIGGYVWLYTIDWRISVAVFLVMAGLELQRKIKDL